MTGSLLGGGDAYIQDQGAWNIAQSAAIGGAVGVAADLATLGAFRFARPVVGKACRAFTRGLLASTRFVMSMPGVRRLRVSGLRPCLIRWGVVLVDV